MKHRGGIAAVLAAAWVLVAAAADAEVVTWQATGTIDSVVTSNGNLPEFSTVAVGDRFILTFAFDASSTVYTQSGGQTGVRYRYTQALSSVHLQVDDAYLQRTNQGATSIDIWDGFSFAGSPDPAMDGLILLWGANSTSGGFAQLSMTLRGNEYLDIFTGPGLPESPSPLLTQLSQRRVQFLDGGDVIAGVVESITRKPPEPVSQLSSLIAEILTLNLQRGISNSFDSKLENALAALDRAKAGDAASAIGMLYAFIQSVSAQSGKSLTADQASELIDSAQAVIDALSQP